MLKKARSNKTFLIILAFCMMMCLQTFTVKAANTLAAPQISSIKITQRGLVVRWNAVANATQYRVYVKEPGASQWTYLCTTKYTSIHHTGLTSGKRYFYTVRAEKGSKLSGYNRNGVGYYYLSTPSIFLSKTKDGRGIRVAWSKVSGANKYIVYRRKYPSTSWVRYKIINGGSNTSFADYNVSSHNMYTYTVRPMRDNYSGSYRSSGASWNFYLR